jgi:hypothetical protein
VVLQTARGAAIRATHHRDICVLVSLDVRNAFNMAPWCKIDGALQNKGVPEYLIRIIRSYLEDRFFTIWSTGIGNRTNSVEHILRRPPRNDQPTNMSSAVERARVACLNMLSSIIQRKEKDERDREIAAWNWTTTRRLHLNRYKGLRRDRPSAASTIYIPSSRVWYHERRNHEHRIWRHIRRCVYTD